MALELKLYDTLTREKRVFTPIDPARVRMYVCGPTVYDFAHIGNARPVIVFDVLFRLLRHIYGAEHVTYVRNITDVDDKINARAAERGVSIRELTEQTYKNFQADVAALGCLPPTVEPRATEHIEQMKVLIERLVAGGHAYVADDNVLFNVPSMPDYGQLSKRPLDEMIAGARVEVAPYKKDPTDFVLWKPSKPGEPGWASPAGIKTPGRPGWHIECSAMADYWLWTKAEPSLSPAGLAHPHQFDIHGGGIDLVFPHHENEIAQSRCAFHTGVMANYWMHNGFLQVEGEKMSKSLGNFVTIRDVLATPMPGLIPIADEGGPTPIFGGWKERWNGLCARFSMLQTKYREPIDWTARRFNEAGDELYRFYEALRDAHYDTSLTREVPNNLLTALCDDLNTPAAVTTLRAAAKSHDVSALGAGLSLLGLLEDEFVRRDDLLLFDRALSLTAEQKAMVNARNQARARKDWKESDRIRDELAAMGVVLKDSKDGTTWELAR